MTFVAAALGAGAGYLAADALGASALTGILGGAAIGSQIGGSMAQSEAARQAAQTQLQGTQDAARIQKEMFDILNAQQAPYREAGKVGLTKIQEMLPFFTKMPTEADITAMPGYQFGLKQGLGSVSQGMNVLSPGSNVDVSRQKFATDYAMSQGLPAYLKQRSDIFNTLASIAGIGQKATDVSSQLGASTGSNLSQLAVGGAGALAGGQVGAANAMAGGVQNIGNMAALYGLMNKPAATTLSSMGSTGYVPSGGVVGPIDYSLSGRLGPA
jgi:hypothetical protein